MSIGLMDTWLSLIPVKVTEDFQIWRVFTYMFLHGRDLFHLLFNMFILWMFGPEIERVLGSKRFLKYYLFTGAGAGLCSLVTNPFDFILVVGASGAMYAIMLAFAIYFPNRKLLLFFIIPVKAKFLVIGLIIFELMLVHTGRPGRHRPYGPCGRSPVWLHFPQAENNGRRHKILYPPIEKLVVPAQVQSIRRDQER